jgi:Thioredoxin
MQALLCALLASAVVVQSFTPAALHQHSKRLQFSQTHRMSAPQAPDAADAASQETADTVDSTTPAAAACCEPHTEGLTLQQRMAAKLGQSLDTPEQAAAKKRALEEEAAHAKRKNWSIAIGSFVSSAFIFFAQRSIGPAEANPLVLLRDMESGSPMLTTALANGKPTVVDFYASWCGECQHYLMPILAYQIMFARDTVCKLA